MKRVPVADVVQRGLAAVTESPEPAEPEAAQVRDYAAEEKAALAAQRERDEAALREQRGRE